MGDTIVVKVTVRVSTHMINMRVSCVLCEKGIMCAKYVDIFYGDFRTHMRGNAVYKT